MRTTTRKSLMQFAEDVVGGEAWHRYEQVKSVGHDAMWRTAVLDQPVQDLSLIPFDQPKLAQKYIERVSLERTFRDEIISRTTSGEWTLDAMDVDTGMFVSLDGRSLLGASINFELNEIDLRDRRLVQVCLTDNVTSQRSSRLQSTPVTTPTETKALLKDQLRRWFVDLEAAGEPAQSERKFREKAREKFRSNLLSDYLFRQVWRDMGHPHPLKLLGREPTSARK